MNQPLYFPSDNPKLFGWLHQTATAQTSDLGVVVCKPFGYEAICSHRSLRAFAEAVAAAGMPVLRFDYAGSGDSADSDTQADHIEQWCGDIVSAVHELRRRTGVRRVCLLGFRLGAMLATLATLLSSAAEFLILVAPVVNGRRYLGEMRTTTLAAALKLNAAVAANGTPGARTTMTDGSMEVSAHRVSAATIAHLSRLDLASSGVPPVSRILIIDRDDLPTARSWAASLGERGLPTDYAVLPGFVKMMLTPAQFTSIPQEMIGLAREWLLRLGPLQQPAVPRREDSAAQGASAIPQTTFLALPDTDQTPEAALTERPVQFGNEATLFGIVTEPRQGENRRRAVILVNAGADYHVATGRMHVSLARGWARRGYVVLRMDLAGLGDSDTRPGRPDNEVFPPAAIDDIRAATSFVRERYRAGDVTVAGLCSGAYHALQAAANAVPLNRILMVNPETFSWREDAALEDIHPVEVLETGREYGKRLRSWESWKKLLAGKADVRRISKRLLLRFTLPLAVKSHELLRTLKIRLPNDLGWKLQQIAARGIQTTMVFSRGEPGIELLRIQAGSAVDCLGDRLRVHIIDNADHMFSRSASRAELQEVLSTELFRGSEVA